jgi:competence protein ComEC
MRTIPAILGFLAVLLLAQPSGAQSGEAGLRVVVMDVGEGQAILLRRGDSGILIDSGPAPFADQLLRRIEAHGVTSLDYLFLTHLHPDHVGGYFPIRGRYPEAVVIDNGHPLAVDRQSFIVNLYDDALSGDPRRRVMRAGDELEWRGVTLKALWPDLIAGQNLNRNSLVLSLTYGMSRALFMGDTGEIVERRLIEQGAVPGRCLCWYRATTAWSDRPTRNFLLTFGPGLR